MNSTNFGNPLPFSQLNNEEFRNFLGKHSIVQLNDNDIAKLRNLIFNPFSLNGRGKSYLTLNSNLDPDQNYYNAIINYIDARDYYNEDTFKQMTKDPTNTEFSILHLNIRSIMNKFDDFKAYLNSLEHDFSVIGLSETWLNSCNINNFPLPNYCSTGIVR